ncbi:MAG: hypothetical protein IJS82_04760 [Paludibacteraceae bacterium]|nr:hypothetical protein [Paludibacteraceae bacterium]
MASVTFSAGIDHVSGALAKPGKSSQHSCEKMLLATHRVAETTNKNCNRLFLRNKPRRSTPTKDSERVARARFGIVARNVNTRMHNLSTLTQDQEAFLAQKNLSGGKKTFRSYIWKLELQAYDESHS